MLITKVKCTDQWKTVKTKCENNTTIAFLSSMSPKNPSLANSGNRFYNLMFTEIKQIEIHESKDHTSTNHHKRCEITNAKSK